MGMIGFGQPYELVTRARGIAQIHIEGRLVFEGYVQFGLFDSRTQHRVLPVKSGLRKSIVGWTVGPRWK